MINKHRKLVSNKLNSSLPESPATIILTLSIEDILTVKNNLTINLMLTLTVSVGFKNLTVWSKNCQQKLKDERKISSRSSIEFEAAR